MLHHFDSLMGKGFPTSAAAAAVKDAHDKVVTAWGTTTYMMNREEEVLDALGKVRIQTSARKPSNQ